MVNQIKVCVIYACGSLGPCRQCVTSVVAVRSPLASSCTVATVHRLFAFPSQFGTVVARSSSLHLPSPFLLPLFNHLLHGGNRPETTLLFFPNLNDDVVEELIDQCDVITSASMAGSFKPILDSTNNIITRNPRVKERFDLPYLLRHDIGRMGTDDGGLALCKLMPLDNDMCDVKMPSVKGKS